MSWYPIELDPMIAVAAATLDEAGMLVEANAGFRRLTGMSLAQPLGNCVAAYFLEPPFPDLAARRAGSDGEIYSGPLIIGQREGRKWALLARVWRSGGALRLLAEHDIARIERTCDVFLQRNGDYTDAPRDTGQTTGKRARPALAPAFADPLTGVGNRRRLGQALSLEIADAERTGEPLCALMADLDHFKCVNDRLGHQVGDGVLVTFAGLLLRHTRQNDVVTRFGGDEFVILLPQTHLADARTVAEHIRSVSSTLRVDPMPEPITASLGVAQYLPGEDSAAFIRRIDRALYKAKRAGRNCVVDD